MISSVVSKGVATQLSSQGFLGVSQRNSDEIRFSCPFHENENTKTCVIVFSKSLFHCYSCKKRMYLPLFFKEFELDSELKAEYFQELKFSYVKYRDYEDRYLREDNTLKEKGQLLWSEAGDYRLFPKVEAFLKSRLGPEFKLPRRLQVKYHEGRDSILLKGVEGLVNERFPKSRGFVPLNHGDADLLHHFREPVLHLFITEGPFDYLKLHQLRVNACSLMASNVNLVKARQIDALAKKFVYLFLDNDNAGRAAEHKLYKMLTSLGKRVRIIKYGDQPWGADPGDLDYEELVQILEENIKSEQLFDSILAGFRP